MKHYFLATRRHRHGQGLAATDADVQRAFAGKGRVRIVPDREDASSVRAVNHALLVEVESAGDPPVAASNETADLLVEPVARFVLPWCGTTDACAERPPTPVALPPDSAVRSVAAEAGRFEVVVQDAEGRALEGAQVQLWCVDRVSGKRVDPTLEGRSGADGIARFALSAKVRPIRAQAMFYSGHWDAAVSLDGTPSSRTKLVCHALPTRREAWWLKDCGVNDQDERPGEGVTVGILDTGVGRHPALVGVRSAGAFLPSGRLEQDQIQVGPHGTHVAGIIAAKPWDADGIPGIAHGATVYSARVFQPDGDGSTPKIHQGSLAQAIRALSAAPFNADLLNLSLFTESKSEILEDAVEEAYARGTLCICAAGNRDDDRPPSICFPAGYARAIAVAALGQSGIYPAGSYAAETLLSLSGDRVGRKPWVVPSYSIEGEHVDCAAPGSGIVSTVYETQDPRRVAPYAVMSGTSMATAIVTGLLARVLSTHLDWRDLPRGASRADRAREILERLSQNLGLAPKFQGKGLVKLGG